MPDSSVVLSKRNKPAFQVTQLVVFVIMFLVISVGGIYTYNYYLPVQTLEKGLPPIEKITENSVDKIIEPVSNINSIDDKPKDVFLGLGSFTSTGFINTAKSPINLFTGTTVSDDNQNNLRLRPWAVMIKNKPEDRPQTAISEADIVYEAVDELGVTSLLGIYYENRPVEIGPVADLKYYFASFALEYSPFLIFNSAVEGSIDKPNLVDESVDVYKFIGSYGLYSISEDKNGDKVFSKIVNGSMTQNLLDIGKLYNYLGKVYGSYLWVDSDNYNSWSFKDDSPNLRVKEFSFNFWDLADYKVKWIYNSGQNNYLRYQGGVIFTDKKSGAQVKAKNIVLLFAEESQVSDAYANLKYNLIGKGEAYFYLDGNYLEGNWEKLTQNSKTKFYEKSGDEVKLNKGNIWIEVLPAKSKLKVVNTNN